MIEPDPQEIERMQRGKRAEALSGAFAEEIAERMEAIDKRIFARLTSGEPLDPQIAAAAWAEKHALNGLLQSLGRKTRIGQGAAKRLGPAMDSKSV